MINISITCETERMINELEMGPNEITCDPIYIEAIPGRNEFFFSFDGERIREYNPIRFSSFSFSTMV